MSEELSSAGKEAWEKARDIARKNYYDTSGEISRLYGETPGSYRGSRWQGKELPGGVNVRESSGDWFAPGRMEDTSSISDLEGSLVSTRSDVNNPIVEHKTVDARTRHATNSGQEVAYEGLTTTSGQGKAEVKRAGYIHEFSSPEAAPLITKLALKRINNKIEKGRQEETDQPKAA